MSLLNRVADFLRRFSDYLNLRSEEMIFLLCIGGLTVAGAVVSALRSGVADEAVAAKMKEQAVAFKALASDTTEAGAMETPLVLSNAWGTKRDSLRKMLSGGAHRSTVDSFITAAGDAPVKTVNINDATVTELASLPGIGEKIADRIVAYRAANGEFANIEELQKVKGIGKKLFAKIKPFIDIH